MAQDERQFGFERLWAWQYALEALEEAERIAASVGRPYGEMADQLRRASLSAVCNSAEGVGKEGKDQLRFFRIARGSAYESAALVEAAARLRLIGVEQRGRARRVLLSVAALLTRLLRRGSARDAGCRPRERLCWFVRCGPEPPDCAMGPLLWSGSCRRLTLKRALISSASR